MGMTTTTVLTRTSGLVLWTVGALMGGCASTSDPGPEPSGPSIAPPPGRYTGERAAVEGVYREFWRISWVSHNEPDTQWENELRRVTSGQLANHISSTARQQRAEGSGLYGEITPRGPTCASKAIRPRSPTAKTRAERGSPTLLPAHPRRWESNATPPGSP